jgi:Zn-dependent protease
MLILKLIANPLLFIISILGFLIGITVNKWAQAKTAVASGDLTPKLANRLTFNPFKHLDFWGTVYFLISGTGWAKPVPINPFNLKSPQKTPVKIILMGFLANIILALIISIPVRLFNFGIIPSTIITQQINSCLQIIIEINLLIVIFNLIPIPPLDGSKILFAFMSQETQVLWARIGTFILFGLLIAALLTSFNIFSLIILPITQYLNYLVTAFPFS